MGLPHPIHRGRARALAMLAATALAALGLTLLFATGDAQSRTAARQTGAKPTIVFVHGAFADASGFGVVTSRLQARGYTVISPADPLRGPASDAAYVASVMKTIDGPIVLVGHSYGGAVITEAATEVGNVKALVYLNALAMDTGESNLGITQRFPNQFEKALVPRPFPQPDGTQGTDLYIDPARFHALFAADVPARTAAEMASAQRPVSLAAIQEKSTTPAWKTIPSWYLIGRQDQVINPAAQRFMARRAHAHTVEIDSSHASYISHPAAVAALILRAARAVG
jgi:pimeloyl-ACP methyl ester carboxylesterase